MTLEDVEKFEAVMQFLNNIFILLEKKEMEIKTENLKEYLTNLNYETIKNLIKKSKNDSEKNFYVDLLNLILQYQQEEAIKKASFNEKYYRGKMINNIIDKMTDEYISDLLVRAAHHSTAIEGNTLTLGDTISILIHNYIPKGMSEREYYEVKNYKKAFEFLLKSDKLITANLIKNYHKYIMENLREDNGEFKKIQNIILGSVIETTKPYLVPTVVEDWCQNLKYRLDNAKTNEGKIEAILNQHIKFEKIHPFGDGNGRTGRLLIIHSCLKENLAPILIPKEEKGKYINFLTSENLKEFVKWGIELEKKEKERIELFYNKEKENLWSKKIEKDKSKGFGRD